MNTTAVDTSNLQRLGVAAADDLRKTVRHAMHDIFARYMQQIPAALNDAAAKAAAPSDRAALQDLSRALPPKAGAWVEAFLARVDAQLIGGVITGRHDGLEESDAGDESVAVVGVELRAEERYRKLITELDARFNRVRLVMYVPVYTRALAPAGLVRSLQDTADAMKWPARQRRLLLECFEAVVVPELDRFYRTLIDALKRMGSAAARAKAQGAPSAPRKAAPRVQQAPTAMQAPADTKQMDAATLAMLESLALNADGDGYNDGLLAADLLALSDGKPLPGVQKDQSWIPLQRIALAGHFLNVVISDAMVPEDLRPQHESVRFPLMKSALTDDTLFTSPAHPLGSLIHELLLKSAASRVTGNRETRRMAELLQQVLVQFDLAPEFVRQAMAGATPIGDTQIQRFFELQRRQAQQRRDFVIAEAKRMVVKELERATFGRPIPAPAVRFLNSAWGPLLTKRLLQYGAEHTLYKQALEMMEQALDRLEARTAQPADEEWKRLLHAMGEALRSEGLPGPKVDEAVQALDAARLTPLAEAV